MSKLRGALDNKPIVARVRLAVYDAVIDRRHLPVPRAPGSSPATGSSAAAIQNATIVRADSQRNVLLVRGPVPGPRNALILRRKA